MSSTGTHVSRRKRHDACSVVYIALGASYARRLLVKSDVVMPLSVSRGIVDPRGGHEGARELRGQCPPFPNEIRRCKFELYDSRHDDP